MFRLFLAGRYLVARPVSYLATGAIAIAIMAVITVWSIMNGFLGETISMIRGTTADIVIMPVHDPAAPTPRAELEQVVLAAEGVEGAVSRFVRPALFRVRGRVVSSMSSSIMAQRNQVLVMGIDPAAEREVSDLARYLTDVEVEQHRVDDEAEPFRISRSRILDDDLRNAALPGILLGEDLMNGLRLRRGMALELVTATDGNPFAADPGITSSSGTFIVTGAFRTGHYDTDTKQVMIPREAFARWAGVKNEVSEIYVKVAPGLAIEQVDEIKEVLKADLSDRRIVSDVETWYDRNAIFLNAVENERNILAIVLSFFVLLTSTLTLTVLTMMVREKLRDIGILASMGAPPGGIAGVFALCAVFVATLGGLLGLGLGTLLSLNVNAVKDWIEDTFGIEIFRQDVYAFRDIPSALDVRTNLIFVGTTIVFSVLICAWPALRSGRMDPVEALRHE